MNNTDKNRTLTQSLPHPESKLVLSDAEGRGLSPVEAEWRHVAIQAYRFKQLAKRYGDMAREHMDKLKSLSGQKTAQYGNYILECVPRKGVIDYSQIPALKGMDLEPYRKEEVLQWKLWRIETISS